MSSSSRPSDDRAALDLLRKMSEDTSLRLSSDDRVVQRFNALVRIAYHHGGKPVGTNYVVVRDQDRVGILMLTDAGSPFCFMTNNLVAAFAGDHSGTLLIFEGGNPSFQVGFDDAANRGIVDVSYSSSAERPRVLLDLPSLLNESMQRLKSAKLDRRTSTLSLTTERATASVELATEPTAPVPIKSIVYTTSNKHSLAIGPIGDGTRPSAKVIGAVSNHSNPATDYHFKCRHFERRASVSRRLRGDQLRGAKDGWRISSRWQSIRQSSDWRG